MSNMWIMGAQHDLEATVAHAKKQATMYYNEGESEMSDQEFNQLIEAIRFVNPQEPILFQAGWGLETDDSFYPHSCLVTGLDDNKFETQIAEWFEEWQISMAKYDGLTGVAYYRYGKLSKVLTRGNGTHGKDITAMAIATGEVPLEIDNDEPLFWTRGEFVMSYATFEAGAANNLWKLDSHPRNVAAGALNGSDADKAKHVDYIVFETSSQDTSFHNRMMEASLWNFRICEFKQTVNKIEVGDFYHAYLQTGAYPIDGVVVHFDSHDARIKAKVKFPATEIEEMEVRLVEWRMRRTGKMSPRVHFRHPKFISGCWFRKATGNNAKWLQERGIGRHAVVRVQRANEVIPNILDEKAVLPVEHLMLPTHCPECDSELEWQKSDLMCMNDNCSAKKGEITYRLFSQAVPKGAGSSFIEEILEWIDMHFGDTSLDNCIEFIKDVHYGKISLKSVVSTEHKQKQLFETVRAIEKGAISIETILWIMNMRTWGNRKCKKFATQMRSWIADGMWQGDAAKKLYVDELPETRESEWASLFAYFTSTRVLVLEEEVVEEPEPVAADSILFGITGKLDGFNKSSLAAHVIGKAVWNDKEMTILVTDSDCESAKMKKAKAAGIPVMTSADFLKHLGM